MRRGDMNMRNKSLSRYLVEGLTVYKNEAYSVLWEEAEQDATSCEQQAHFDPTYF